MKITIKRNCKGAIDIYRIKKNGCIDNRGTKLFESTCTEKNFDVDIKTEQNSIRVAVLAYSAGLYTNKTVKVEVTDGDCIEVLQDGSAGQFDLSGHL